MKNTVNDIEVITEKDMDMIRERYNSIVADAKDFYECEKKLEAFRDDPDILEFRDILVSDFIDFLTIGAIYYNDRVVLQTKAIELIRRQNKYLDNAFGNTRLTEIIIPPTVKKIGRGAFDGPSSEYGPYIQDFFTVYGKRGSYAEKYAKKMELKFVTI